MTEVNPTCYHLSASAIAAYKACPTRFRLGYREGLRLDEDTESQRIGTNWHALHEVYWDAYNVAGCAEDGLDPAECARERAFNFLNEAYQEPPPTMTPFEFQVEREILLQSFFAYLWYWQHDPIDVVASEVAFRLPIHDPAIGLPLPTEEVVRVGKIDHVVEWQGMIGNVERKSTTRDITPGSDYWSRSTKDTQVSMYALAFRDMLQAGQLPKAVQEAVERVGRFGNTLYDVWRRPSIKPKALTQKDTAAFLETGEYMSEKLAVEVTGENGEYVRVEGDEAEVEFGKSGKPAIKETVSMFGARLWQELTENPERYFQRREIARTDRELRKFRTDLYNIYQMMRMQSEAGTWFENEAQCQATFRCPFIPICYGPGADGVCDGQTTPVGFKRIFVDPTANGTPVGEPE